MSENDIATENDLLNAIRNLMKKNGHLDKLQAEIRAKITEALQQRQLYLNSDQKAAGPPQPTDEVLLVNQLIREYLEWNGYLYTASVLCSESAMSKEKKSREELCAEVGVKDDEKSLSLPLLSNIVAAYTERIKRKINKKSFKI